MVIKQVVLFLMFSALCLQTQAQDIYRPDLDWGIKNEGRAQPVSLDHFTRGWVPGLLGQDIQLVGVSWNEPSEKVIVAVIDTGIDLEHPDFREAISDQAADLTKPNQIGKSFVQDQAGHGTHVAGVIKKIAEQAVILPIKVFQFGPNAPVKPQSTSMGTALIETVAYAINYAIDQKAKVINMSLAWPISFRSDALNEALDRAEREQVLIVASAGNDGTSAPVYPCAHATVVCVGAHGPDGSISHFSNYGNMVSVFAPGLSILSAWPLSLDPKTLAGAVGYELKDGTSMAAPFVSGVFAKMLAHGMRPFDARAKLMLGSRGVQPASPIIQLNLEKFSRDTDVRPRTSRFGLVDVMGAMKVTPRPLVMPLEKEGWFLPMSSDLNAAIKLRIKFKNFYEDASNVQITVEDSVYSIGRLSSGHQVDLNVEIPSREQDVSVNIISADAHGTTYSETYSIPLRLYFSIRSKNIPSRAKVDQFQIADDLIGYTARSVKSDVDDGQSRIVMFRGQETSGTASFLYFVENVLRAKLKTTQQSGESLLDVRLTGNGNLALVFSNPARQGARPDFTFYIYDLSKYHLSKVDAPLLDYYNVRSDVTVLQENFVWDGDRPVWVSVGKTPKEDIPAFDPWNPDWTDSSMLRIYTVINHEVRLILPLRKNQVPVIMLPDANPRVVMAEGEGNDIQYQVNRVVQSSLEVDYSISDEASVMLFGQAGFNPVLSLEDGKVTKHMMALNSNPGNMSIGYFGEKPDWILRRSGPLDFLKSVSGVYRERSQHYAFAQSHFDMKFYRSGSDAVRSLSLNKYSYIPSLISSKSWVPTRVLGLQGRYFPAIYQPASLANGEVSEVIYADPEQDFKMIRSQYFRFKIEDERCQGLGNLTPQGEQLFICGKQRIRVPLVL